MPFVYMRVLIMNNLIIFHWTNLKPLSVKFINAKPLLVLNWYRPPNSKSNILNAYEDALSFMETFNYCMVLMGDINIYISNSLLLGDKQKYCQINNIHGMQQINTNEYTRITNESATLVD